MNLRKLVFVMGCSLLALACVVQPEEAPGAATQNASLQDTLELVDRAASEASEGGLPFDRCDDNVCFRACTQTGACDGFCISNVCTCVGTSGPPCS